MKTNQLIQVGSIVLIKKAKDEKATPLDSKLIVASVYDDGAIEVIGLDGSKYAMDNDAFALVENESKLVAGCLVVESDVGYIPLENNTAKEFEVMMEHSQLEEEYAEELEEARENYADEIENADTARFIKIGHDIYCDACYDSVILPEAYVKQVEVVDSAEYAQLKALEEKINVLSNYAATSVIEKLDKDSLKELLLSLVPLKHPFLDEKYQSEINYITASGYYLKDEDLANDELIEHTDFTYSLLMKGLNTKSLIQDNELLELVAFDFEKGMYYAQWFSEEELEGYDKNGYQYLYFN